MSYPFQRNCREATRLVLEGHERALTARERIALRLHWMVCDGCASFRRQAEFMRAALGRWRRYRDADSGDGR